MKKIINLGLLLAALMWAQQAQAQDPQFSQTFNAPNYLNPAYVGSEQLTRFTAIHRGQWLGMPGYFITSMAAIDAHFEPGSKDKKKRSKNERVFRNLGIGALFMNDLQGGTSFMRNYFAGTFACEFGLKQTLALRTGVQMGVGQQTLNYNDLVFGDMITSSGLTGQRTQEGMAELQSHVYPDISWGGLLYSPSFQFGLSLAHLNQPDISFLNNRAPLPIRATVHTSYLIPIAYGADKRRAPLQYVKPFLMYRAQGKYDQLDGGANLMLNPVVLGFWYRGLLVKQEGRTWNNQDAVCLYFGANWGDFEFGTSYDITVSRLGASTTAGSYEISLRYLMGKTNGRKISGFTASGDRGIECKPWNSYKFRMKKKRRRR